MHSQVLGRALNSTDEGLLRQKDGALLTLGTLHDKLTKKKMCARNRRV